MSTAFRQTVAGICKALPGAEVSDPWGGGHDAWKVGGKMFACIGAVSPGIAVKCRDIESANLLCEIGAAARAPYFHKSWVLLPESTQAKELADRLRNSYELIRAKLPAAKRRELDALS